MKKIYYGRAVYDKKEINAVLNVLKNDSLSLIDGKKVKTLEKKISQIFGKKYGLMVNSGSSANLLALSSFKFKKGSEIIRMLINLVKEKISIKGLVTISQLMMVRQQQ